MRCSESVMTVLENRGLIRKEEAHCIHCGCLWDTANDTSLCLRCRSGFYFSIPAIVTGDGFSKKRCKTGYEGKLLTYRWCEGCQQFHWLRWLYFFFFILVNLETHKQKYFSSIVICIQWLHTESAWSLISLAQVYRKVPSEITFSILHHIRNAFGHSLQNYCVRCLKKNLSRNDLTNNRTVCGKRVSDVNIANEPRLYDITH